MWSLFLVQRNGHHSPFESVLLLSCCIGRQAQQCWHVYYHSQQLAHFEQITPGRYPVLYYTVIGKAFMAAAYVISDPVIGMIWC